ncbi:MAG: hypothetical protein F6K22_07615 [Okeania sp. SIO2F4]|uniref:hypothetical protein n=1 Tax=Okeania sp. SIO2F4 TaxID=2607790 RepID=UPI00142915CD|nr:hypothetical protein [Okeania sp. SIO2F4]NES02725.1 hypothetical protein [Okeania sp. SIO2F4]
MKNWRIGIGGKLMGNQVPLIEKYYSFTKYLENYPIELIIVPIVALLSVAI